MCRSEPRRDDLGWRISNETPLLDPFRTRTSPPKKCEGIGEGIGLRQFQKTADFWGSLALFESSSAPATLKALKMLGSRRQGGYRRAFGTTNCCGK